MSLAPLPAPALRRSVLLGTVGLVLVLGLALRLRFLDEGTLFIDEAESSINALSILEHGYPADRYLGLPMFENTLVEPWPESEEYEFRDSSYSRRGMAIYHGWLPLYAIAASLVLHGIEPDQVTDPPSVKHTDAEIRARIRAARLPAVVFAGLFLVAIYLAGSALFGVDAGLSAMLAAALAPKCVWLAQQARYYSAALAFSTLAVYCTWRVYRRGSWRDFLLAALAFVLLFHTSSLAFALALLGSLVLLPGILRHDRVPGKLAASSALVAVGLVPWMLWTGYFEQRTSLPMARSLLEFPADYLVYLRIRPGRVVGGTTLLALFVLLWLNRARLPARLARPLAGASMPILFLTSWIVLSYFGFQVLVPAASCSMARLSHNLIAGPILLSSVGLAVLARSLLPGRSTALALTGTLALLAATNNVLRWQHRNDVEERAAFELVEHLRGLELTRDTRIYSLPYQHFCLTYYTGLPIQSIAPMRREFLDSYPGEVLILETTNRLPQPLGDWVRRFAQDAGVRLSAQEAGQWVPLLHALMIRNEVAPLVHEYSPDPGPLPEWVAPVIVSLAREIRESGRGYNDYARDNPAMFHGHPPMTLADFWPVFFYRFVGSERRSGERVNYGQRMREASALMLPSTWIVLRCPARTEVAR